MGNREYKRDFPSHFCLCSGSQKCSFTKHPLRPVLKAGYENGWNTGLIQNIISLVLMTYLIYWIRIDWCIKWVHTNNYYLMSNCCLSSLCSLYPTPLRIWYIVSGGAHTPIQFYWLQNHNVSQPIDLFLYRCIKSSIIVIVAM